jgi:cytosine/adenosine deaminase-related metal-dependent hydrolase
MQPDEVYIGQLVGCMEAIRAGVTTVVDHSHVLNTPDHAIQAISATKRSGIRSKYCYSRQSHATSIDPELRFDNEASSREWHLEQFESLAKLDGGRLSDRIDLGLAYDSLLNEVGDVAEHHKVINLAREHGASLITAHAVGGPVGRFSSHCIRNWHEAGLLKNDVLFSHANGLVHVEKDPKEWEYLKTSGAKVSITPEVSCSVYKAVPPKQIAYLLLGRTWHGSWKSGNFRVH